MIDEPLKRNIKSRIKLEKEEQQEQLLKEINSIRAKAAASGGFGSGHMYYLMTEACRLAVRNRGQFIWNTIWRFVATAGVSYSSELKSELMELFSECLQLPDGIDDLMRNILSPNSPTMPGMTAAIAGASSSLLQQFEKSRADTFERIAGEIDLFVMSLKRVREAEEGRTQTMNFYAPVGAVQAGTGSNAYVTQNISNDAKTTLNLAFDAIIKELPEIQNLPGEELLEIVEDARREVSRDKPNSLKVQTYIITIGTMIQATAALKPAYDLLKQGAAYFGISLP